MATAAAPACGLRLRFLCRASSYSLSSKRERVFPRPPTVQGDLLALQILDRMGRGTIRVPPDRCYCCRRAVSAASASLLLAIIDGKSPYWAAVDLSGWQTPADCVATELVRRHPFQLHAQLAPEVRRPASPARPLRGRTGKITVLFGWRRGHTARRTAAGSASAASDGGASRLPPCL